jgi:lytic murein transglycosylase
MMARLLPLSAVLTAVATWACAQEPVTPVAYAPPAFETSGSPAFDEWRQRFAAQAVNVHGKDRAIVEAVLTGLTPNAEVRRLNDSQPEFVRPIWTYIAGAVSPSRIAEGRAHFAARRAALAETGARTGVPVEVAIAIWGLESSYGAVKGGSDVPRALATLAHAGRRTALGEAELLAVFDILSRGEARREDLVGSWAGAMGHTQFMPSSFLSRAVDGDGDGRRDIWNNPVDALASTLNYLSKAGWRAGEPWGAEARAPAAFDWTLANSTMRPLTEWRALGVTAPALDGAAPDWNARLLAPAGANGAVFLVGANFDAVKAYNNADAYALSVALLSDQIAGRGALPTRWPFEDPPLPRAGAREMQTLLNALGFSIGEPDGQAGPRTRRALQAFQAARGLVADGYPSARALEALRDAARAQGVPMVAPPAPPPVVAAPAPVPATPPANQPAPKPKSEKDLPIRMFGPPPKGG